MYLVNIVISTVTKIRLLFPNVADLFHQFPNRSLFAFDQLHEAVVLEEKKTGDSIPLVVFTGLVQNLPQILHLNALAGDAGVDEVEHALDIRFTLDLCKRKLIALQGWIAPGADQGVPGLNEIVRLTPPWSGML